MRIQQLNKYVNHIAWTVTWSVRYFANLKISFANHNVPESLPLAKITVHVAQTVQQGVLDVPHGNAGNKTNFVILWRYFQLYLIFMRVSFKTLFS